MTLTGSDGHEEDPHLPRVRRKGLPLWIFRLIKCMLWCCPLDAYVAFPLLFLMIIAALGFLSSIFDNTPERVAIFIGIGVVSSLLMIVSFQGALKTKERHVFEFG